MAEPDLAFPVGIHGDDASAFTRQKVLVLTFNSSTVSLQTLDNRILFTAVSLLHAVPETLTEVYKVLAWSLNALAEDTHPIADHNGKLFSPTHHPERYAMAGEPLTKEFHRGIWSELRGDWKWQMESLNLEAHYNKDYVCYLCRAHKKIRRLFYIQFARDAHI